MPLFVWWGRSFSGSVAVSLYSMTSALLAVPLYELVLFSVSAGLGVGGETVGTVGACAAVFFSCMGGCCTSCWGRTLCGLFFDWGQADFAQLRVLVAAPSRRGVLRPRVRDLPGPRCGLSLRWDLTSSGVFIRGRRICGRC